VARRGQSLELKELQLFFFQYAQDRSCVGDCLPLILMIGVRCYRLQPLGNSGFDLLDFLSQPLGVRFEYCFAKWSLLAWVFQFAIAHGSSSLTTKQAL
jgi:hypothetical protein